jgi:hypothetical protein
MTLEERSALMQKVGAARLRSNCLVAETRRYRSVARAARRATANRRREAFVLHIRGGGTDPVSELTLKDKLASGVLPQVKAMRTWYGRGEGKMCVACDLVIGPQDIEVEADFDDATTLRFHSAYLTAWNRAATDRPRIHGSRRSRRSCRTGCCHERTRGRPCGASGEGNNNCGVCELPIRTDHLDVEVHFDGFPALRLHSGCYHAWQRALRLVGD